MKPKNFADVRFDNISCGLVVQHVFMFQKMAVRINRVFHETKRFSKKFNEKPYIKKLFKPYYGWPFLYIVMKSQQVSALNFDPTVENMPVLF